MVVTNLKLLYNKRKMVTNCSNKRKEKKVGHQELPISLSDITRPSANNVKQELHQELFSIGTMPKFSREL